MDKPDKNSQAQPDKHSGKPVAHNAHSVSDWRRLNTLEWPEFLWFTVPAGFALATVFNGAWILAGICAVLTVLGVVVYSRRTLRRGHFARAEDVRKGDYPYTAYAAVFAPLVLNPLSDLLGDALGPVTDNIALPAAAGPALEGIANTVAFTFAAWLPYRKGLDIPRRRVAQVLAAGSLEGVTTTRIEAIARHQRMINALVATGCGPGVALKPKRLARLMEVDVEDIKQPLLDLRKEGIVTLQGAGLFDDPTKWEVAFTEDGIRCIDAARRR